jgi:hypothetical protein
MDTTPQVVPESQAPEPPFASCRFCGGAIQRNEQVAYWARSGKVAHVECYDLSWVKAEQVADRIGAA